MRLVVLNLTVVGMAALALALAVTLLHLVERAVGRFVSHRFGWHAVLLTGWIGVPIHELSHLIAAVVFGHRIVNWSLFDPDPATGTLGYVHHAYRRRNPWQLAGSFFVGLAPLFGGAAVLTALLAWMVPPRALLRLLAESRLLTAPAIDLTLLRTLRDLALGLVTLVWRDRTFWLPLQLYLCAAVAAHLAPSRRDLVGGAWGGLFVGLLLASGAVIAALVEVSLAAALIAVPATALLVAVGLLVQGPYVAAIGVIARLTRR